jgi:hypothetical protein
MAKFFINHFDTILILHDWNRRTFDEKRFPAAIHDPPQSAEAMSMNRFIMMFTFLLFVCAGTSYSQDELSTTRIQIQHRLPDSMKTDVARHEQDMLKNLANGNPTVQARALQTLRDLEQLFPDYAFQASIAPLGAMLRDEHADRIVRRLAALALDGLHSEAGDVAIADIASFSQDEGLQTLCMALLTKSQNK